jgi:hypothetical protein
MTTGFSAALSAQTALDHFREALRAKQERVKQAPAYPAPNDFTGRHDFTLSASTDPDKSEEE